MSALESGKEQPFEKVLINGTRIRVLLKRKRKQKARNGIILKPDIPSGY